MFIARFLLDVVVCVWLLAAIPKLLSTGVDIVRKMADGTNSVIRKAFQLDKEKPKETWYKYVYDDEDDK